MLTSGEHEAVRDRKKNGKKSSLLSLKKSERVRLVDVTSLRLCKSEKGLLKIGLARLAGHVVIALMIVLLITASISYCNNKRTLDTSKWKLPVKLKQMVHVRREFPYVLQGFKVLFDGEFTSNINVSSYW